VAAGAAVVAAAANDVVVVPIAVVDVDPSADAEPEVDVVARPACGCFDPLPLHPASKAARATTTVQRMLM
jgi:hypothetical protein